MLLIKLIAFSVSPNQESSTIQEDGSGYTSLTLQSKKWRLREMLRWECPRPLIQGLLPLLHSTHSVIHYSKMERIDTLIAIFMTFTFLLLRKWMNLPQGYQGR